MALAFALALPSAAGTPEAPVELTVAGLREMAAKETEMDLSFRLAGVVRAIGGNGVARIALQDESGAEILDLPTLPDGLEKGRRLVITANHCAVIRGPASIQVGTGAVVSIDGIHSALAGSGKTYLRAGMQPVRLEWFNRSGQTALRWSLHGHGLDGPAIPEERLWRGTAGPGGQLQGLDYAAYEISPPDVLPDFTDLTPVRRGTVPHPDVAVATRGSNVAVVFTGFVSIPEAGVYEVGLVSDDGARLFLGTPDVSFSLLGRESLPPAVPVVPDRETSPVSSWGSFEGNARFFHGRQGPVHFELSDGNRNLEATAIGIAADKLALLEGKRVRIEGVRHDDGICVVSENEISAPISLPEQAGRLTTALEVRRLHREDAAKGLPAEITGVVTMADSRSIIVQDQTGGVFIMSSQVSTAGIPGIGQIWKITGKTAPGDFSPVVMADKAEFNGFGALPKPVRPVWEQLLNGSPDAEQVEIEGVLTSLGEDRLTMMTRDGEITILDIQNYPFPAAMRTPEARATLPGSRIRMRGVYGSSWQVALGRVMPAVFSLGNAVLSIDEQAPADPFDTPASGIADLLHFTSESHSLKRVRVRARVAGILGSTYLLSDGRNGLRLAGDGHLSLGVGDEAEVVGFPRPGGPSPVLLHPVSRVVGRAGAPPPTAILEKNVPDSRLDCQPVVMDGTVIEDEVRGGDRIISLRWGARRVPVVLPAGGAELKKLVPESLVRVSGVYASLPSEPGAADSFEVLAKGPDITVLRSGPWWTTPRLVAVVSALSGGLLIVLVWVTMLHRVVARRSLQLSAEIHEREVAEAGRILEMERSRVARDLHDELGASLTEAGMLSSLLKNPAVPQETKKDCAEQLNSLCFTMVSGLDEIVWAVNPRYDSLADTGGYLWLFAQRLLELAGIGCRLRSSVEMPQHRLDSRRRHGLFLAFKEALNNVVRHSHAAMVHLSLEIIGDSVVLEIVDDGCGFDPSSAGPGSDGLSGMAARMTALGGTCSIDSKVGAGTTVKLGLPLNIE